MHVRLFMGRMHARFNPDAYAALMSKPGATLNSAHMEPHLLLHDAEVNLDPVAEKQFLSMIKR